MAVLSLNKAYDDNVLKYLCNTCGDVIDSDNPGSLNVVKDEDVMDAKELVLYRRYWEEGAGCCMYVLRVKGRPAIGLGYLFDDEWCRTIVQSRFGADEDVTQEKMEDYWMPRLYRAVNDAAVVFFERKVAGCDIYVGNMTDPEGHEMLVVVPYDRRGEIRNLVDALTGCVYETVEELF